MMRPLWMIRAGSVQRSNMPAIDERTARGLSYLDLLGEIAGTTPGHSRHLLFQAELRRRESSTARLSLAVSVLALLVSFVALLVKA